MSEEERTTTMTATTGEKETTIESVTIATTPRIIIVEEITEDTQNDESTQIRIEGTRSARGIGTIAATTVWERSVEKNVGNRSGNTEGRRI